MYRLLKQKIFYPSMNSSLFPSTSTFLRTFPSFLMLENLTSSPSVTLRLSKHFQLPIWPTANVWVRRFSAKVNPFSKPTLFKTALAPSTLEAPHSSRTTANFASTTPRRKSTVWATTHGSSTPLELSPPTKSAQKLELLPC
jgi:hypothetical protein